MVYFQPKLYLITSWNWILSKSLRLRKSPWLLALTLTGVSDDERCQGETGLHPWRPKHCYSSTRSEFCLSANRVVTKWEYWIKSSPYECAHWHIERCSLCNGWLTTAVPKERTYLAAAAAPPLLVVVDAHTGGAGGDGGGPINQQQRGLQGTPSDRGCCCCCCCCSMCVVHHRHFFFFPEFCICFAPPPDGAAAGAVAPLFFPLPKGALLCVLVETLLTSYEAARSRVSGFFPLSSVHKITILKIKREEMEGWKRKKNFFFPDTYSMRIYSRTNASHY